MEISVISLKVWAWQPGQLRHFHKLFKRIFYSLNMHEKSGQFAPILGLGKTLIFYCRFLYLPTGACRGRYTNSLHILRYNVQTIHCIFKSFISWCSGDYNNSPCIGNSKFFSARIFGYNPKYAKPTFANFS